MPRTNVKLYEQFIRTLDICWHYFSYYHDGHLIMTIVRMSYTEKVSSDIGDAEKLWIFTGGGTRGILHAQSGVKI